MPGQARHEELGTSIRLSIRAGDAWQAQLERAAILASIHEKSTRRSETTGGR